MKILQKSWQFLARHKKAAMFVLFLLLLIFTVLIFLVLDSQSKANFAKYKNESNRLISLVSKADGVVKTQPSKNPQNIDRGDGLLSTWKYCGIDSGCNDSRRGGLILVPRGQETAFFNSWLRLAGYEQGKPGECYPQTDNTTLGCSDIRNNSQFHVYFLVTSADPDHYGAPVRDDGTSPNVWKYVDVLVMQKYISASE